MEQKTIIAGMFLFSGKKGVQVSGAKVYLQSGPDSKPIAFQKTGEAGKVTFAYLDKGVYRILLDIPRQKGKLEAKEPWNGDIQVAYHGEKKLYLFHEPSGFFSIRFSKLSHLNHSNVTPMYELDESSRKNRIVIAKFEVEQKYGSLTLALAAHTQYKFHKLTNKYREDAEMSVIRKGV